MLVCGPWMPLEADLCTDARDRWGLSPRPVREIDAGDPGERGPEITGGCVSLGAPMRGRRRGEGMLLRIDEGITGVADALDVLIAGHHVLLGALRERQGWGACADLCGAVIPLQGFGHGVRAGLHARVPRRGEDLRSAFPSHHRADHAPPRHACHVTHHVVQGEMHVLQRLVQVLHRLDGHLEQSVPMAEETAEPAQVLRRTARRRQQAITRQSLPPWTIAALRCRAARDMRDVAGMDQGDRTPASLEDLQPWHPLHTRGFHGHRRDTTGSEPVGQAMHVTGKGAQFLERLGIAVRRHTDPVLFSPHIDAGGMRMHEGHRLGHGLVLLAFFGHTFLQSGAERGEEGETERLLSKETTIEGASQRCGAVSS